MVLKPLTRPIRTVLRWQLIATAALSLAAALLWGLDGACSAALGGAVNLAAGAAYGWRVAQGEARTAGQALVTMLRAWGIKILVIVAGLVLALKLYPGLVPAAFLATFVITVGVFAAAIAVPDTEEQKKPPAARDQ